MSRILKRPMFRIGGSASEGTGITSGLEEPRRNYQEGTTEGDSQFVKDFTKAPGIFSRAWDRTIQDLYELGSPIPNYFFGERVVPLEYKNTSFKPSMSSATADENATEDQSYTDQEENDYYDSINKNTTPDTSGYTLKDIEKGFKKTATKEEEIARNADLYARLLSKYAGPGRPTSDQVSDLLIRGGLNLMSARPMGKGLLGSLQTTAQSFREPAEAFLKGAEQEQQFKRSLGLEGAKLAITSDQAKEIARAKLKNQYEAQTYESRVNKTRAFYEKRQNTKIADNADIIAKVKEAYEMKTGDVVNVPYPNFNPKNKQYVFTQEDYAKMPNGVFFDVTDNKLKRKTIIKNPETGKDQVKVSDISQSYGQPIDKESE